MRIHSIAGEVQSDGTSLILMIALPIVAVVVIVTLVLLLVPSIRKRLFPHRDRSYFDYNGN